MRQKSTLLLFLLIGLSSFAAFAQTAVKPSAVSGEVVSSGDGKIVLQTKDGALEATLSDKTQYFRVPPENPTLKAAVPAALSDISTGDKVLVTGVLSEDKKTMPARSVYLITKSDLAQKNAKEQEEWRARGLAGRVVTFNPQTNVITVSVRGLTGERTVEVTPKEKAEFYRYAPDSIKFSEAKRSHIGEIELGDSIRVLGDKSADGASVQAEKIVTGAFRTVGGTVTAINPEKNEIVINDFQTKKDVTVVIGDSSVLKQFPAEMAQRMAQFQSIQAGGGQGGFRPPNQGGQTPPSNAGGQTPPNGQGGMGPRGAGGIDDMLDRFPNIKITDLKVGEMVAVSSTKTADVSRIRAIKLLSGVEPFVRMAQAQTAAGGNRGGAGVNTNFQIPGLDGFGTP